MARLCVDFGGTNIKMGLSVAGEFTTTAEFPVTGTDVDLRAVAEAAARFGVGPGDVDVVAMAVPGLIDLGGTRLVQAHGKYDWMLGADLGAWTREAFGAIGVVENDARAALVGELAAGALRGERNAVALVLGTGIGTAAMLDGRLVRGATGAAGNLGGHVTLDWSGPVCNCGNIGCAEVYGGSWALRDRVADALASAGDQKVRAAWTQRLADAAPLGFAEIFQAAAAEDAVAVQVRDRAIRAWAVTAVACCHLMEPGVIILAGGVARSASAVLPALEAYVRAHIWSALPVPRFVASEAPELSVLRGLAVLEAPTDR